MGDNSKMSNSKKYEIDMCNGTIMDKLVTRNTITMQATTVLYMILTTTLVW